MLLGMDSLPQLLCRLGQAIRARRTEAGYSQERFGFAIGLHRTYMGHLERGTANPTMKTMDLVAEGLGVSISSLLTSASVEISGETRTTGAPRTRRTADQPSPAASRGAARPQVRKAGPKRRGAKRDPGGSQRDSA
jgi:transcriptional regulator with XRE-family HTH domain